MYKKNKEDIKNVNNSCHSMKRYFGTKINLIILSHTFILLCCSVHLKKLTFMIQLTSLVDFNQGNYWYVLGFSVSSTVELTGREWCSNKKVFNIFLAWALCLSYFFILVFCPSPAEICLSVLLFDWKLEINSRKLFR